MRATKGQHTKAFDDQPIEPPKKRGRKKKQQQQEEEAEDEIIRCVCGATEQDSDSEEPWIACDRCGAWQHNVCMGMSVFTEDLPKHYYCEQCAPQDHKMLLTAMEEGKQPWEDRRKKYEEEQAEKKKKKKKPGRPAKATTASSEQKEERAQTASTKGADSPAPEAAPKQKPVKKETGKAGPGKRKAQEEAEKDPKVSLMTLRYAMLCYAIVRPIALQHDTDSAIYRLLPRRFVKSQTPK